MTTDNTSKDFKVIQEDFSAFRRVAKKNIVSVLFSIGPSAIFFRVIVDMLGPPPPKRAAKRLHSGDDLV